MEMLFKLLAEHVYIILFVSLILEFACLPLPGETMMVVAGIMAYNGHGNYVGMIIASALGTVIGMQFSYEVGRRLGTKAIDKYGCKTIPYIFYIRWCILGNSIYYSRLCSWT